MGFHEGSFATVWSVNKKSDTMTTVRLSTSRKLKDTNEYQQDFSGFVGFVGRENAQKALNLKEKDRIQLGRVDVSTKYNKETKQEFINYTCFGFELKSANNGAAQQNSTVDNGEVIGSSDDESPFF